MEPAINEEQLEKELRFGPGQMWWSPALNEHPEAQRGREFPERVVICDETLREGEETPGAVLDIGDRVAIARKLEQIGVPEIEIGYVGAIQEHTDFSRKLKDEGIKPKLVSHTRIYTRSIVGRNPTVTSSTRFLESERLRDSAKREAKDTGTLEMKLSRSGWSVRHNPHQSTT